MAATERTPKEPTTRSRVAGKLPVFLVIALGWSALVGLGLFLADVELGSVIGVVVMAVLYMPAPLVAAVIAERGVVRSRFRLPALRGRPISIFLGLPVLVALLFVLVYLVVVFVGGDLLGLPSFGTVATTSAAIAEGAAKLVGAEAVAAAGPPPRAQVLLLAGICGAAAAGWTINGLFAMGEEYGWRGLMWEALEHRGVVQANLVIGSVWGLWHAPVILQGYNYPDQPLLGVLAMIMFCTGMSFALTAVRRLTGSLLPVAAAHGTFNALAPILLILAPGTDRILTGPLGLAGALVLAAIGAGLWLRVHRRPDSSTGAPPPTDRPPPLDVLG